MNSTVARRSAGAPEPAGFTCAGLCWACIPLPRIPSSKCRQCSTAHGTGCLAAAGGTQPGSDPLPGMAPSPPGMAPSSLDIETSPSAAHLAAAGGSQSGTCSPAAPRGPSQPPAPAAGVGDASECGMKHRPGRSSSWSASAPHGAAKTGKLHQQHLLPLAHLNSATSRHKFANCTLTAAHNPAKRSPQFLHPGQPTRK